MPQIGKVRTSATLRRLVVLGAISLLFALDGTTQIYRVGAGLMFSSGAEFNYGETGNPGFTVKAWYTLDKRRTIDLVPSLTFYNRYRLETGYSILTNYMGQADLQGQYAIYEDGSVKTVVFGGVNFTYLTSSFVALVEIPNQTISDQSDYAFGGTLGAGLELRMAPNWDFNVSGQYLLSKYSQFIISVQGVYYFKSRRRAYRR